MIQLMTQSVRVGDMTLSCRESFTPRRPVASFFFFFQAEGGIRDLTVTGVQTCALPICNSDAAAIKEIDNETSQPTASTKLLQDWLDSAHGRFDAGKYWNQRRRQPAIRYLLDRKSVV